MCPGSVRIILTNVVYYNILPWPGVPEGDLPSVGDEGEGGQVRPLRALQGRRHSVHKREACQEDSREEDQPSDRQELGIAKQFFFSSVFRIRFMKQIRRLECNELGSGS